MIYAKRLAYSMHLAWKDEFGEWVPFHHNEGILYAKAVQKSDGTLIAKSLRNPWMFAKADGGYGVAAVRTEAEGEADQEAEGCILLFSSNDMVHWTEQGLFRLQQSGQIKEVRCSYQKQEKSYRLLWKDGNDCWRQGYSSALSGKGLKEPGVTIDEKQDQMVVSELEWATVCAGNVLEIPEEDGQYLLKKLMTPVCRDMQIFLGDKRIDAKETVSKADLHKLTAKAFYSDGTSVVRKIDWTGEKEADGKVTGMVHQEHFPFPFAENRADPCCMYWHGKYYYIATNDADGNHTLYIRCAETLEKIVEAKEVLLLDSQTYPDIGGLLWAPEFHEIGGSLYIFHAATEGEFFREESRVMKLKDGGDPMRREDWSAPKLVVKKDGTPLCEAGKVISLDMTTFDYMGKVYAMWSQRQFLPVDQGAWLYLAQIDEEEPWKLISDPVCIALPEYGWENNHTFVVEGPYALERGGQLMITYSGAAVDATYTVGLLKPVMGTDILNPKNWQKSNYPLMSSRSAKGQYGPGHNSYLLDENGLLWNFYHARDGVEAPRSSGARRVHFDVDGEPVLDLVEEMDIPEEFRTVEVRVL